VSQRIFEMFPVLNQMERGAGADMEKDGVKALLSV
jgi:hypothetical protein